MSVEFPITEVEAGAMLAQQARRETLPTIAKRLNIPETRLLDMIQAKEPLSRHVMRDLGLMRQIRYRVKS
jgi:hypothetical protein